VTSRVELSIPDGWEVVFNNFGDVDPVVSDGTIVDDGFFQESLLWIRQVDATDVAPPDGYGLYLGWFPESDPDGAYRLSFIKGEWDNMVVDHYEVQRLINRLLRTHG
jgi:hypothetical protein